jgi:hypothetical protein
VNTQPAIQVLHQSHPPTTYQKPDLSTVAAEQQFTAPVTSKPPLSKAEQKRIKWEKERGKPRTNLHLELLNIFFYTLKVFGFEFDLEC